MTDRNERLKSIRELVHDHWFCDNPNCSDVEDEILFLLALVERYEKALKRIAAKCKDNYWAAIADGALRPKEAVLSSEALKAGERE